MAYVTSSVSETRATHHFQMPSEVLPAGKSGCMAGPVQGAEGHSGMDTFCDKAVESQRGDTVSFFPLQRKAKCSKPHSFKMVDFLTAWVPG